MARPASISGFPEWTPAQRIVEQQVLDVVRRVFELHGFGSLETRAVETVEQLLRKGEIDKEVYGVRRLAAPDEDDAARESDLALHFDLTVPFARYVLENAGHLTFPFRRYQVQKVWRGERPQEGRYREFTQADIDVVDRDELPFHYEVELPLVMAEVFRRLRELGLPPVTIQVSNRKLAEGFYRGLGLADPAAVLRCVDKLDKVGPDGVAAALAAEAGADEAQARACLGLAGIRTADTSFVDRVRALGVEHPLLAEGLDELGQVVEVAATRAPGAMVADLRIARGLDYYTGTVYETQMEGFERYGSVASGGRYDALASDGRTTYPGVGISFGVTRALGLLFARGLTASRSVPTCVLVALMAEEDRVAAEQVADRLRARGIATQVSPTAAKLGKQIRFADRRGVPFVWFPGQDGGPDQVKDIRSGDQVDADPGTWEPPAEDLHPRVVLPSS
ncbi:histidine--tRNA ligase [Thalassiella azotivora]